MRKYTLVWLKMICRTSDRGVSLHSKFGLCHRIVRDYWPGEAWVQYDNVSMLTIASFQSIVVSCRLLRERTLDDDFFLSFSVVDNGILIALQFCLL